MQFFLLHSITNLNLIKNHSKNVSVRFAEQNSSLLLIFQTPEKTLCNARKSFYCLREEIEVLQLETLENFWNCSKLRLSSMFPPFYTFLRAKLLCLKFRKQCKSSATIRKKLEVLWPFSNNLRFNCKWKITKWHSDVSFHWLMQFV